MTEAKIRCSLTWLRNLLLLFVALAGLGLGQANAATINFEGTEPADVFLDDGTLHGEMSIQSISSPDSETEPYGCTGCTLRFNTVGAGSPGEKPYETVWSGGTLTLEMTGADEFLLTADIVSATLTDLGNEKHLAVELALGNGQISSEILDYFGLSSGQLVAGGTLDIEIKYNPRGEVIGFSGHLTVSTVPLPPAAWLFGSAIALVGILAGTRRRRRATS